jgi:hypothetical protein
MDTKNITLLPIIFSSDIGCPPCLNRLYYPGITLSINHGQNSVTKPLLHDPPEPVGTGFVPTMIVETWIKVA